VRRDQLSCRSRRVEVTAVDFIAHDGEVAFGSVQGIGLPREAGVRYFDAGFHPADGAGAGEAEMFAGIIGGEWFAGRFPYHLEGHASGRGRCVDGGPTRLIDDGDAIHLQSEDLLIRANGQAVLWNGHHPVQARRRDGWVQIVDLIGRNQRSLKERESYVREGALLRGSGSPIFALHHAIVGGGSAECDAVSVIVRAHPGKGTAPRDLAPEVVDVGRLQIGAGGLIVAAVLIQPRNRIRVGAAVGSVWTFFSQGGKRRGQHKSNARHGGVG